MNLIKAKLRIKNSTVQKIVQAAYGRSVLCYFGILLVVNGVWDLEKISNQEYFQRRSVLGFSNNVSNEQIKGKTAHWFARPLPSIIVDLIERQKLLP